MNRKVFRLSAWYDLAVSAPFALPVTLTLVWDFALTPANAAMGFPALSALTAHGFLFANFFGSVVTIWAVVRLYLDDIRLAAFDGVGRLLFSIAMVNALLSGASPLIWGVLVIELVFAFLQLTGFVKTYVNKPV
jgi:hypothetical protein